MSTSALPSDARSFAAFMEEIWEMRSEPTPNGGLVLFQHPAYDNFHNALRTIKMCKGAYRTGGSKINGIEDAHVYRFHGDANVSVLIRYDGGALKISTRRYGPRAKH